MVITLCFLGSTEKKNCYNNDFTPNPGNDFYRTSKNKRPKHYLCIYAFNPDKGHSIPYFHVFPI